jgi:hypothetical protein
MVYRLLAALTLALALVWAAPVRAQTQGEPASAVIELFTSQGCGPCPRANRLLGRFSREDGVLALTFPVGIWDYLGWHDTLALPEFSERQRAYSRALRVRGRFTPQLVINGATQISASDWDGARAAFEREQSEGWPPGAPALSLVRLRSGRVRATLGAGTNLTPADVWLVNYDGGPITVFVRGGDNINRNVPHYNLVTRIDRLGVWAGEPVWFERGRCTPRCAVIVQGADGGAILAAAFID